MSKSYREVPHQWGPRPRKPQYEPTIEEELNEMNPEEIYAVVSEWKPTDSPYELEETVAHHRTETGAIASLHAIAEGQGYDPRELGSDTEFSVENPNPRTEYMSWYITTAILED